MKAKFPPEILGRVKSAGIQPKAAVVQTRAPFWNARLRKWFVHPKHFHISDPTNALRAGDTVAITRWPSLSPSKRITHTVTRIVAAWGADEAARPSERPALLTEEQRRAWRRDKLLKHGTAPTQQGLRDGSLYIGEHGEIMKTEKAEHN